MCLCCVLMHLSCVYIYTYLLALKIRKFYKFAHQKNRAGCCLQEVASRRVGRTPRGVGGRPTPPPISPSPSYTSTPAPGRVRGCLDSPGSYRSKVMTSLISSSSVFCHKADPGSQTLPSCRSSALLFKSPCRSFSSRSSVH